MDKWTYFSMEKLSEIVLAVN